MTQQLVRWMTERGWAVKCSDVKEAQARLNLHQLAASRLALVSKTKPSREVKHRLIRDFRKSGANSLVHLGEGLVLPRAVDVDASAPFAR